MASVVLPDEEFYKDEMPDEESEIRELAKIQAKLEIYAYTHKKDIDKIRSRIEELLKQEVRVKDKEKMLDELDEIKTKYKVFGRYIEDNDWENLYRVKFNVLMSDINESLDSPLRHGQVEAKEFEYYKKIIEDKISEILMAQNPELEKTFGSKNLPQAIKLIQSILKNGKKTFDFEQILKDKNLLRLILAFDRPNGIEKMTLNKDEAKIDFYEYFEWAKTIPVKSLHQLTEPEYSFYVNGINVEENMYVELYKIHDDYVRALQQEKETKDEGEPKTHTVPEGIVRIGKIGIDTVKSDRQREHILKIHRFRQENYDKIIFPSTLKYIGKGFIDNTYITEIEFNEGLEEIGKGAFQFCSNLGRYKNITFPTTLKKIDAFAFYNCFNMAPAIFNEGLEEIGTMAFYNNYDERLYSPSNIIILPHTIKKVGESIVNDQFVKNLGFKDYRGQDIPERLWVAWIGKEDNPRLAESLEKIFLFRGDSLKPYMEIDTKRIKEAIVNRSEVLRELVAQKQKNEER